MTPLATVTFNPELRNRLGIPEPKLDQQTKEWFRVHENNSQADADTFGEDAKELGKGAGFSALCCVAAPWFPPVLAVAGLSFAFFGFAAKKQSDKSSMYRTQNAIVRTQSQIWQARKHDAECWKHLKNRIEEHCEDIDQIQQTWQVFNQAFELPKLRSMNLNGKKISKIKTIQKKSKRKERLSTFVEKKLSSIQKRIKRSKGEAKAALYTAVAAREQDVMELNRMHIRLEGIPTWITDGSGGIQKI